jgi:hypothetical protein
MPKHRCSLVRHLFWAPCALLCLPLLDSAQDIKRKTPPATSEATQASPAKLINLILIDTAPFQEPNLSLKGFLHRLDEVLRKQGKNVPVQVDFWAFKDENPDVYKDEPDLLDTKVKVPAVPPQQTLQDVIHAAVASIPTHNATHIVRKRQIWITTLTCASPELLMELGVTAQFDRRPLASAVRELSELTGVAIVVDPRIGKADTPVTATFDNRVPLRTALALLADMTGQKVFEMNGALYLTTPENAKALLKDLLPIAPQNSQRPVRPLEEDLSQVPEAFFEQPLSKNVDPQVARKRTAQLIGNINLLNKSKTDHFMEMLLAERPDLTGLPIVTGEACRSTSERSGAFKHAVAVVRTALESGPPMGVFPFVGVGGALGPIPAAQLTQLRKELARTFWDRYPRALAKEDENASSKDPDQQYLVTRARIAALMQVLAPEPAVVRLGLVSYLGRISRRESTEAVARLALFSAEDDVRAAALNALKGRSESDYTATILQGLRYPLPAVARRASEMLVKLDRKDLIPQLVKVLNESDPRAPTLKETKHQRVLVVRELVRINHHRNCLLCHGPASTSPPIALNAFTAAVPIPGESFGYLGSPAPVDFLAVNVDVTYLRQDFSMFLPVAEAEPWPEMQRFDFVVRTRVVTDQEAKDIQGKLAKRVPGEQSPYHRAVLAALRELTGRDTEPTPQAWRRLLGAS